MVLRKLYILHKKWLQMLFKQFPSDLISRLGYLGPKLGRHVFARVVESSVGRDILNSLILNLKVGAWVDLEVRDQLSFMNRETLVGLLLWSVFGQ